MHRLNDKQLDERINRFIGRKMQQFPELRHISAAQKDPQARPSVADTPFTTRHRIPSWHLFQVMQ
jgi:hypothetical protein